MLARPAVPALPMHPMRRILPILALLVAAGAIGAVASRPDDAPPADPFKDRGVPAEQRRAALGKAAKEHGREEVMELLEIIGRCADCPAARDWAAILEGWDAAQLGAPAVVERLTAMAAPEQPPALRVAAARAFNALPEAKRPEAARALAPQRVEIVCVPGQMRWEPKEFSVPAGRVLEIRMRNDDTMQHNLLIVAPGSLSEIGVAADRMGETAEGKAREWVPDSPKVLQVMGLVDPGRTGTLWLITPAKPGTYPLVCTYPGHWRMMNGKMRVTKPEG